VVSFKRTNIKNIRNIYFSLLLLEINIKYIKMTNRFHHWWKPTKNEQHCSICKLKQNVCLPLFTTFS